MKQSLQVKMGQQLAMTPQLQQAIKLLQLSTLELQSEIQDALENNPMLETQEDDAAEPKESDSSSVAGVEAKDQNHGDESPTTGDDNNTEEFTQVNENSELMPDELPVDSAWEDVYESSQPSSMQSSGDGENRDFTEFHNSGISSIQDHLNEQIRFAPLSERDQIIATTVIDAVDDNGYLLDDLDVLLEGLNKDMANPDDRFEMNEDGMVYRYSPSPEYKMELKVKSGPSYDPDNPPRIAIWLENQGAFHIKTLRSPDEIDSETLSYWAFKRRGWEEARKAAESEEETDAISTPTPNGSFDPAKSGSVGIPTEKPMTTASSNRW